jgi:hypothetical protein
MFPTGVGRVLRPARGPSVSVESRAQYDIQGNKKHSWALFVCVGLVGRNNSRPDCFSNLYKLRLGGTILGVIRRKRTRPW